MRSKSNQIYGFSQPAKSEDIISPHKTAQVAASIQNGVDNNGQEHQRSKLLEGVQLIVRLRVDRSRLRLTCLPDSPVMAELTWTAGGLTLQKPATSPDISATCFISDLTVNVRHEYLSNQASVSGTLKDLAGTMIYRLGVDKFLQVVVDSTLDLNLRLVRFQDLLCLKAVWMDHLSAKDFKRPGPTPGGSKLSVLDATIPIPNSAEVAAEFANRVILFRVKRISVSLDLIVTKMDIAIEPLTLSVRHCDGVDTASLTLENLEVNTVGIVSGNLRNPRIALSSIRRSRTRVEQESCLLKIRIDAEDLAASFDHEAQGVIRLE